MNYEVFASYLLHSERIQIKPETQWWHKLFRGNGRRGEYLDLRINSSSNSFWWSRGSLESGGFLCAELEVTEGCTRLYFLVQVEVHHRDDVMGSQVRWCKLCFHILTATAGILSTAGISDSIPLLQLGLTPDSLHFQPSKRAATNWKRPTDALWRDKNIFTYLCQMVTFPTQYAGWRSIGGTAWLVRR